jgi:glycosyltransferase involved in cell wall biosynthesis
MTELAVVLISKNQAWNITRLVESVLRETAWVSSREIVLVDSASTDKTVDIACHYPINILRLWHDQHLTPAAGRYVGYTHTMGDYVLFLDGDMEFCQGWLEQAFRIIQSRPDIAVVTGQVVDLPKTAGSDDKPHLAKTNTDAPIEVLHGGGAAMYRRSVLEEVGTFNPYLYSDEEPELCVRIRHRGYRILQLGYPIVYHYSDPKEALFTLVNRWRRNLYVGPGQNLRYLLRTEMFWPYLKERGDGCVPALGLAASVISFLWSLKTNQWLWFSMWLLMLVVIVVGDAYRKRSFYQTFVSLLKRLFIVDGTVRGFLLKPLSPGSYPARLDVIKRISYCAKAR